MSNTSWNMSAVEVKTNRMKPMKLPGNINQKMYRLTKYVAPMLALVVLMLGVSNVSLAQADEVFVIGEISNIPGGGVTNPPDPAAPTPTPAPTPDPSIPVPSFTTNGEVGSRQLAFRAAMAELGYIEGENLTYIFDSTSIFGESLDTHAQLLVASNVDIIVAYGTSAALAAKRATEGTSIPVVFVGSVDPVQLGLVASLQNTEGNVTGVGGVSEAYAKQLELLIQIDPSISTVYMPYPNLNNPVTALPVQAIQAFAEKSGITLIAAELPTPEEVAAVLADLPDVDAIILVPFAPSPFDFVTLAKERQIPLAYSFPNLMDLGPLLSYNYTEKEVGTVAARYVDRILKGAKPSDLPVEIAANSLAINLQTAEAIGLTLSDDILLQADILVR